MAYKVLWKRPTSKLHDYTFVIVRSARSLCRVTSL
ncbi:hypothetical protein KPSA1_07461 [Pseudomonas syringae pv. actinidiae]|uniref:Uncharacterized protein n=1 Tax=Pseudomonas syringae pv. actinidiae TaxID=103796 RepID=A0A2V0QLG6_PSESF|nr:hypothetical protein KPSA1_07461 [Pseudomonas syringae pv. actinidiae]